MRTQVNYRLKRLNSKTVVFNISVWPERRTRLKDDKEEGRIKEENWVCLIVLLWAGACTRKS